MKQPPFEETAATVAPFFMEHRWGQRVPCDALVRVSAGEEAGFPGRVRNISSSGAFIETAAVLPANTGVSLLVLGNESATHAVEIAATVVRSEHDGIAVEWNETPSGSICAKVGCTTRCRARKH